MDKVTFYPIGTLSCQRDNKYDQPRQAVLSQHIGKIELRKDKNFEQSLIGLQPGDFIWVLFLFHKNSKWKPMVRPPRGSEGKIGVFATRAPYRPNPIGISVVEITAIDGRFIEISGHDLLDGTPILDLKPYLDLADSHPGKSPSWLDEEGLHSVHWRESAVKKAKYLQHRGVELRSFVDFQLQFNPTDEKRKRVTKTGNGFEIAYRTWRVHFDLIAPQKVEIQDIHSGYDDLEVGQEHDPWKDKRLHEKFLRSFRDK